MLKKHLFSRRGGNKKYIILQAKKKMFGCYKKYLGSCAAQKEGRDSLLETLELTFPGWTPTPRSSARFTTAWKCTQPCQTIATASFLQKICEVIKMLTAIQWDCSFCTKIIVLPLVLELNLGSLLTHFCVEVCSWVHICVYACSWSLVHASLNYI